GAPRFGTVNGASAAAAVVAGAAALLAQARPDLDAGALAGLLAESARPIAAEPVTSQGAGMVDAGAAAAGGRAAGPWSPAFRRAAGAPHRGRGPGRPRARPRRGPAARPARHHTLESGRGQARPPRPAP